MSITWTADVAAIAPDLSTTPTATQTLILAIVDRQIDDDQWGIYADDGRRYLAAHLGTLARSGIGNTAGPVTSETLGAMSRSYGTVQGVTGPLSATRYGVEYERLMHLACGFVGFAP